MSTERTNRTELVADLYDEQRAGATRAMLFHAAVAAKAGLNITDVSCLGVLDKEGPMTAGDLARRMGLTRGGAITAVVDRMERAGFVRRSADPDDRRRTIIEPVRDGSHQKLDGVLTDFSKAFTELIESYTDEQIETLLDFTRRANGVLREQTLDLQSHNRSGSVT